MRDVERLQDLLSRLGRVRKPDRRLDYELFRLFSPPDEGGFWDPQERNEFTSTGPMRHCTRIALEALIAQAQEAPRGLR